MASDAPDAPIQMTATIKNSEIKYDLTEDSDWSCTESGDKENAICTRSWNADQFNGAGETTFEEDNLVLKKIISATCKTEKIDNVSVCLEEGHTIEFKCIYPLKVTTVSNIVSVQGKDDLVSEEGFGQLNYKLSVVDANIDIGEPVNVEIKAINENLVWHTIQDCQVIKQGSRCRYGGSRCPDDHSVPILKWDADSKNLTPFCPNYLGVAVETKSSKDTTKFSWTAFKWSTSTPDDVENQTITCTISLSKDEPVINTPGCGEESVAHSADEQSNDPPPHQPSPGSCDPDKPFHCK